MDRGTRYRALRDMEQEGARVSWKKFSVYSAGRKDAACQTIVDRFKGIGQTEVFSQEESDYVLVVCPNVSRVGTDIKEALGKIHAGKPAALMVMHHTFDREHVVTDSRGLVDKARVPLTADFLFYEGKLLKSKRNTEAFQDIEKFFGVTPSQVLVFRLQNMMNTICIWCRRYWKGIFAVAAFGAVICYAKQRFWDEDFHH